MGNAYAKCIKGWTCSTFIKSQRIPQSQKFMNKLIINYWQLKNEVTALRKYVVALEDRLEEAEAYERRDTIVLSGTELPAATDGENTANTVCSLMKEKVEIVIKKNSDISVLHRLGKKPATQSQDKRSIIVKLCRRDTKHQLKPHSHKKHSLVLSQASEEKVS